LRDDIQCLRAVAVLLVLFFHAQVGGFSAGFLGVDVFFVISGYLITGLLTQDIEAKKFSFSGFYWKRATRLLPAAYIVYMATAVGGMWVLSDISFDRYFRTLLSALTFSSNIELWSVSALSSHITFRAMLITGVQPD